MCAIYCTCDSIWQRYRLRWLHDPLAATASPYYSNSYGAAWNHKDVDGNDHLYFSSNSGSGVFELTDINLGAQTCRMNQLGSSAVTSNNDGMNCLLSTLPYPSCGDKNGPVVSPNPNPVTDQDCGPGYIFNSASFGQSCTTNPCSVGSANAADQATCCIAQQQSVWRSSARICTPSQVPRSTRFATFPSTISLSAAAAQAAAQAAQEPAWDGTFA